MTEERPRKREWMTQRTAIRVGPQYQAVIPPLDPSSEHTKPQDQQQQQQQEPRPMETTDVEIKQSPKEKSANP